MALFLLNANDLTVLECHFILSELRFYNVKLGACQCLCSYCLHSAQTSEPGSDELIGRYILLDR